MNRRDVVLALLGLGAVPFAAHAQPGAKPARIGWLGGASPETVGYQVDAFKQGLRELGYIEGKDFVVEVRWALGKAERFPDLARELVALKPDVIVVPNGPGLHALQQATTTIPIVMLTISDPVGMGFVKSLAHPGGNITGLSSLAADFSPKLFELVLTVMPKLSRVAILAGWDSGGAQMENLQTAAQSVGVDVVIMKVQVPMDIEKAFERMADEHIITVIVVAHPALSVQSGKIAELASKHRMLSVSMVSDYPKAGGLMSYGQNFAEAGRRAATYVDKILKGAKPADLPVEQAATFELVVNLKTANALGITIPQSILLRADQVIK